jgi:hypothetical protein
MNINDTELETDDIYLGAYFMLCKCTIKSTRRIGSKVLWTFINSAGSIIELRQAYYMGAIGNLCDYAQKVVQMKQLCHGSL